MSSSSASGAPASATPNALAREKSPYLRQHQHNPVHWLPWGEAAFAKARAEQKPIFLSIGYSTCHWCHVMAHESFENADIAAQMNAGYVCVKVDREERPDVDRLYMTYVQAATGHGGWPMSVWLTPDLKPFFGGTYFPPEDRWGRPGFPAILARIAEAWSANRESILQEGDNVIESLAQHATRGPGEGAVAAELGWEPLEEAFAQLRQSFDERWGGFGAAPKFPRPVNFNFLFRVVARRSEDDGKEGELTPVGAEALRLAELTLRRMAEGGMRDHLGGGFHRYSVDGEWCVPHFEKMLYDQAQLAIAYLEARQATGREVYAWIARETLAYVQRDLAAPRGGFYSAEDADSTRPDDPAAHGEGAFYVWSKAELEKLAGADADLVRTHYGVREEGNAPEGADPHGEFRGLNILHQRQPLARTAQLIGVPVEQAEERLLACNARLLEVRNRRPRPHRDEKILTAWNGLMMSAFARAAQIDPHSRTALAAAESTAKFVRAELFDAKSRRLFRSWCEGRGDIVGFAEDYAFLVAGLIDLYEAGGAIEWLQWAVELQESMDAQFWDPAGGYFGSPAGDPSILVRMKEDYDGAEPSANSVAALNLLRLGAMLGRDAWRRRGEETIQAFRAQWSRAPHALPQMLVAIDFALGPVRQIVFAGDASGTSAAMRELAAVGHERVEAPRVILWADGGAGQSWLAQHNPFFRELRPLEGKPTAYVCRNFTCQLPTNDPAALRMQLL